jgi:hypothetical protein
MKRSLSIIKYEQLALKPLVVNQESNAVSDHRTMQQREAGLQIDRGKGPMGQEIVKVIR